MRLLRARLVAGVIVCFANGLMANTPTPDELIRFTFTEYHMGIDARVVLYARSQAEAEAAATKAFQRMAELDSMMSDYRADSELMRLCARAGTGPVAVSDDLFRVLSQAQVISQRSGGAFDVTVGPLVQLWRAARKQKTLPDPAAIATAKKLVGWTFMRLNSQYKTVSLAKPGMRLDLGGIAKGYACDEVLGIFRQSGIKSALVEMGGEIALGDAPPGTSGWNIEVPNAGKEMVLHNCAISSSGDTEQYVEIKGIRYSHVVDPVTGYGLTRRWQASVIAPKSFLADPLSTALTVLSPDKREAFLRNFPGTQMYMRESNTIKVDTNRPQGEPHKIG